MKKINVLKLSEKLLKEKKIEWDTYEKAIHDVIRGGVSFAY